VQNYRSTYLKEFAPMVFIFEGIDVLSCFFRNNFASLIKTAQEMWPSTEWVEVQLETKKLMQPMITTAT
jgi:hypothetical protein